MLGLKLFDLHCDTAGECRKKGISMRKNDMHLSFEKGRKYENWCQVFAVWIPDDVRGNEAAEYFDLSLEYYNNQLLQNSDIVTPCTSAGDIGKAENEGKCGAVLAVESGAVFCGDERRIEYAAKAGVKLVTLTWSGRNELGDGCFVPEQGGLTAFGKLALAEMNRLNIAADVSHLSRRGFYDVAEISSAAFLASHSGCDSVFAHPRNLTDEQIDIITQRGGIIGLSLCSTFLAENPESGKEGFLRHFYHLLERGGEKSAALGSDFDGCRIAGELAGVEKMDILYEFLLKNGIPQTAVDACFYENARNYFTNVLHC